MRRFLKRRPFGRQPSVPNPRQHLLTAALALNADVLVCSDSDMDNDQVAIISGGSYYKSRCFCILVGEQYSLLASWLRRSKSSNIESAADEEKLAEQIAVYDDFIALR
jgi:hypothetical protein